MLVLDDIKAFKLRVTGTVQGVGFRPFIYRLAKQLGLKGYVVNLGGSEVEIHIEGFNSTIEAFIRRVDLDKPPQAKILSIEIEPVEPQGFSDFEIRESIRDVKLRSMIPPDIAICPYCISEILDSSSRYYLYYWNSCAWCGPRFSMMYDTPYDRINTSMNAFKLCSNCSRDYEDPGNIRRFHGQGISCPNCGPKTYIYTSGGDKINVQDPIAFIAEKIMRGSIVAIKGVGGYHIACLASDDSILAELRARKKRPTKPFALMARDYSIVNDIAIPPPGAKDLLESPQRPIVIMPKRENSKVSELVAPGLSSIAVMLPYTGFQVLLLRAIADGFLVMTSGNPIGKPMCTNLECVFSELSPIVDYVVEHERVIVHRVDDSVIRFTDRYPVFLRRARGYAPEWIEVGVKISEVIAVGAELQTAGAISFGDKVILTQFIGDMDEPAQLEELERELDWLIKVYNIKPKIIALDMHPLYHNRRLARKYSEKFGIETVEVQHHHAHAASVLGELKASVDNRDVAITIDGTGYGIDGGIWGGEVLITSLKSFTRVGSLKPFILPGGDSSAFYPVKPLISLLASNGYSEDEVLTLINRLNLAESLPYKIKEAILTYTLAKRGRGVVVTSLGRVLDAFSALLGACNLRTYEGEPPMKLESLADRGDKILDYEPKIKSYDGRLIIDIGDMLSWAIENLEYNSRENIALTIQYSLGRALATIATRSIKGLRNIEQRVIVSGGAAVNTYIIRGIRDLLAGEDLKLELPSRVPPGDGGIALGQILIAACMVGDCE